LIVGDEDTGRGGRHVAKLSLSQCGLIGITTTVARLDAAALAADI
jgi:hypothetical protein